MQIDSVPIVGIDGRSIRPRVIVAQNVEPGIIVLRIRGGIKRVGIEEIVALLRSRAGLVIVVHDIEPTALAAVGRIIVPVVNHVVAVIHIPAVSRKIAVVNLGMVDAGVAALVVSQQVMVERGIFAAPDAAIAVAALGMPRIVETLGKQAPLHREITVGVERRAFVHRPRHRTMVEDDILVVTPPDTVLLRFGGILGRIAQTETDIADNHVVGIDPHGVVAQADAVARGGLAGDGQVSVLNAQIAQQFDRSRHVEDDDAFARSLDGLAQRPGARIIEIGDVPDLAAAAARRVHAAALGAREGAQHPVVLVGQGKPQLRIRIDGRTAVREDDLVAEGGILPFGRTERRHGAHPETVGHPLLQLEALGGEARRGRFDRRGGIAGIEFESEAHGFDLCGDRPAHGGRPAGDRIRNVGNGQGFPFGVRLGGIAAASGSKRQKSGQHI